MKAADQGAPQGAANNAKVIAAVAGCVAAAMAVVSIVIARRMRWKRPPENDEVVIIQDMPGLMRASVSYIFRFGTY